VVAAPVAPALVAAAMAAAVIRRRPAQPAPTSATTQAQPASAPSLTVSPPATITDKPRWRPIVAMNERAVALGIAPEVIPLTPDITPEPWTAGTGGIRRIEAGSLPGGAQEVRLTGLILAPLPRDDLAVTPNFNTAGLPTGRDVGLPDYELGHLWGPGFGDEALAGMWLVPRVVNQAVQNQFIEGTLRAWQATAPRGSSIELFVRAESHPLATWRGHLLTRDVAYKYTERLADGSVGRTGFFRVRIDPPEANGNPGDFEVTSGEYQGDFSPVMSTRPAPGPSDGSPPPDRRGR
jgi:hypothetical protein